MGRLEEDQGDGGSATHLHSRQLRPLRPAPLGAYSVLARADHRYVLAGRPWHRRRAGWGARIGPSPQRAMRESVLSSTLPHVTPILLVNRVKGRLQYLVRQARPKRCNGTTLCAALAPRRAPPSKNTLRHNWPITRWRILGWQRCSNAFKLLTATLISRGRGPRLMASTGTTCT